jgi:hypothetical protein
MRYDFRGIAVFAIHFLFFVFSLNAQVGNAGSIEGVVKDPSGAAVVGATVEIDYGVSGYTKTSTNSEVLRTLGRQLNSGPIRVSLRSKRSCTSPRASLGQ